MEKNVFLGSYHLSLREKILFPLVSPYAMRHWKKGSLGHRIVACLELTPLLGPLASLIERISNVIYQQHKTSESRKQPKIVVQDPHQKISVPPPFIPHEIVPPPDLPPVEQKDPIERREQEIQTESSKTLELDPYALEWSETEKKRGMIKEVLLKKFREKKQRKSQPVPAFSETQNQDLHTVLNFFRERVNDRLIKSYPDMKEKFGDRVTLMGDTYQHVVFSLASLPNYVIKFPKAKPKWKANGYGNLRSQQTKEIFEKIETLINSENNPYFLHCVPGFEEKSLPLLSRSYHYVVQEAFSWLMDGSYEMQEQIFQMICEDPDLLEYRRALFQQISLLIYGLPMADVKPDNFIFTKEGDVAIIDPDDVAPEPTHGFTQSLAPGCKGLFSFFAPEALDWLDSSINLDSSQVSELEKAITEFKEKQDERQRITEFHKKHNIQAISQPIPLFSDEENTPMNPLINAINSKLGERKHYIDRIMGRCIELPASTMPNRQKLILFLAKLQLKETIFRFEFERQNKLVVIQC